MGGRLGGKKEGRKLAAGKCESNIADSASAETGKIPCLSDSLFVGKTMKYIALYKCVVVNEPVLLSIFPSRSRSVSPLLME